MTTDREATFLRALGKHIRIARLTRELTQAELADAAGISRNFISLIEHGSHGVDVVRLLRIAAALDIPLSDLVRPEATSGDRRRRTGSHRQAHPGLPPGDG